MSRQYPLKGIASLIASRGRYGDSMIVHMNPVEVAGIAALTPKGLTVNPDTGQLEAYNWMETILPMVGAAAMVAATGGVMAAPLAAGLGSGLTTTALTGDVQRGLLSGAMGAAGGAAFGNAGEAALGATDAAGAAASEAAAGAATDVATQTATQLGTDALGQAAVEVPLQQAGEEAAKQFAQQQAVGVIPEQNAFQMALKANPASAYSQATPGERMTAPFQASGENSLGSQLMKKETMLPLAIGGNMYNQRYIAQNGEGGGDFEKDRKEELKNAYGNLQNAYRAAQPTAMTGYSPYRSMMSRNTPGYGGYAQGGIVRLGTGGAIRSKRSIDGAGAYNPKYGYPSFTTGGTGAGLSQAYGGIDPITVQANLRGRQQIQTPPGFRPGFDPEFNYFQNDPQNPVNWPSQGTQPYPEMQRMQPPAEPYFKTITPYIPGVSPMPGQPPQGQQPPTKTKGMAQGGITGPNAGGMGAYHSTGPRDKGTPTPVLRKQYAMAEGGEVPPMQQGIGALSPMQTQPQPSKQEVMMVVAALTGQAGDAAGKVIDAFVKKFGPETFQMIRELVLKGNSPNAQTQGMIKGPGGGMDDQVMGTIGGNQPVAVSPGEYIVPADVVSGIGDGSSDAGAAELDRMSNNVRMARGGSTTQPPPLNARRIMPA